MERTTFKDLTSDSYFESNGNKVGHGRSDGVDRHNSVESSFINDVQKTNNDGKDDVEPYGVDGSHGLLVDCSELLGERHGTITSKGVDHSRTTESQSRTGEEHGAHDDGGEYDGPFVANTVQEDFGHGGTDGGIDDLSLEILNTEVDRY